ncbi:hypothetical protein HN854_03540 [Candidatus Peregrinibacteria bacterium]|nr:hypothetical protein [Candidatus Peregrinibacteria bacterium]MBT6731329.1 hypothetical protein [Candidatus Peregrinibacteria bacterium]MBT7345080.1 hypothetical protein [Candidatus Peregrinibacteria bacterium]
MSSVASFLPAPILFLLEWSNPPPNAAIVAFAAGVILMVANWLYFAVIFSDAGESTELACYENSSVIVIVLVAIVLTALGRYHDQLSIIHYIGIGIGAIGLWALALWGEKIEFVDKRHRMMLIGFMIFAGSYELLADYAMHLAMLSDKIKTPLQAFVSVTPYFWIGLATGVIAIAPKQEREAIRENWSNICSKWKWIAAAEMCALVAFGTMIYSFTVAHVAVIAMIAGAFPIFVFAGGIILRRYFGFSKDTFPEVVYPKKKTAAVLATIIGACLAGFRPGR